MGRGSSHIDDGFTAAVGRRRGVGHRSASEERTAYRRDRVPSELDNFLRRCAGHIGQVEHRVCVEGPYDADGEPYHRLSCPVCDDYVEASLHDMVVGSMDGLTAGLR